MADPNAIAAAAAAAAALAQAPPPVAPPPVAPPPVAPVTRAFKPYGSPPPFDLEAERDSFPIWEARWDIFLALSTIDEALDVALRPAYKTNQLKSCLSTPTLQAVLSAGLTAAQLADHTSIINLLRTRCNAGRNRHVWRHQFALLAQLPNQTADNWLCSLRDISRKCDFGVDCCANCEPTRILGQLIAGVADNAVRIKLLEQGDALTLDQALTILRTSETTQLQAASLQPGDQAINAIRKSALKPGKNDAPPGKQTQFAQGTKSANGKTIAPCRYCGGPRRHGRAQCPAYGKTCDNCGKDNHYAAVCESEPQGTVGAIYVQRVASTMTTDSVDVTIRTGPTNPPVTITALPDTGSQLDAIPQSLYRHQFSDVPLRPSAAAKTAIGNTINCLGSFTATIDWAADDDTSRPAAAVIRVLEDLQQAVLCSDTQRLLGMLHDDYPHARVNHISPAHSVDPSTTEKEADLAALMAEFPTVFDGICRVMDGPPCHFVLRDDAVPVKIRGSRPISEPLKAPFREELAAQISQGIIRKVPPDAVTPWIHGVVVVPKKQGGVRFCPDYRPLNKYLIGSKFDNPTPFQSVRSIPQGMRFFTVVDALMGYHQCALDEESMALTTFATPEGLHQYTRLPMGICHAGDDYGRRFSDIFGHIPNTARCMEDLIVYSRTYEEHKQLLRLLFRTAQDHNVSFNRAKTVYASSTGTFAGYIVSADGFHPNPNLTQAIREFPCPKNITDLRSFFGLCQQVGNFSSKIAASLAPLAELLKKSIAWDWTPAHDAAFRDARETLAIVPDLSFYEPGRPTALYTDASLLNGLGFILKQRGPNGNWNMVQAGSRFLRPAETRYAMIELECLAASWAMKQCRQFLEGLPTFELITDHRPLIPILNDYALDKLDNQRLLRLRLKMSRYIFTTRWVPGKQNIEADALSRAPVGHGGPEDELGEGPQAFTARAAAIGIITGSSTPAVDLALVSVKTAAAADPVFSTLRRTILEGFPNDKCNLPLTLRPYWDVRHRLAIDDEDDMIVMDARIVLPRALVKETLQTLASMHQGATKMRQRARLSLYWPHMDSDIINAAASDAAHVSNLPSLPAEPIKQHEPASRPFEFLHADIGEDDGRHFLVIIDQFSGWPHVVLFPNKNTTANRLIIAFREFFVSSGGAPTKLWTDNSPFQAAEFQAFLSDWKISWGSSSPHYAQSNGRAEAGIKSMKKLVIGSKSGGRPDPDKLAKAILLFRNAPRLGGASPAQLVFNRPIRDGLPAHHRSFAPEWQQAAEILEQRSHRTLTRQVARYNRSAHPLPAFSVGDHVLIQHPVSKRWVTPGVIVEVGQLRDYLVKTDAGRILRRNRRFLRTRIVVMPGSPTPVVAVPPLAPNPPPDPVVPPEFVAQPRRRCRPAQPSQLTRQSSRVRVPSKLYPASTWTK